MTTLTTAPRHQKHQAQPTWTRMAWVTWRQHRAALTGVGTLLGGLAAPLGVTGLRMQSASDTLAHSGCTAFSSMNVDARCGRLWGAFYHAGYPLTGNVAWLAVVLAVVPLLTGVFVGAPLLAREFEAGTARFAWTQAVGRTQWLVAKVALIGAVLAAAAAAFGALAGWWLLLADRATGGTRWDPGQFGLTAVTFTGWTLLLFAAGVLAGAAIRRTVPAMAATAAAGAGLLWLSIEKAIRPLTSTGPLHAAGRLVPDTLASGVSEASVMVGGTAVAGPPGGWVLGTWFTGPHGQVIGPDANSLNPLWNLRPSAQVGWLAQHHLTVWVSYQPASRFWLFQAVVGAAAVAIALLFTVAAAGLARRGHA